jgi:hypothetical protein
MKLLKVPPAPSIDSYDLEICVEVKEIPILLTVVGWGRRREELQPALSLSW